MTREDFFVRMLLLGFTIDADEAAEAERKDEYYEFHFEDSVMHIPVSTGSGFNFTGVCVRGKYVCKRLEYLAETQGYEAYYDEVIKQITEALNAGD